jgi:hypothetical protein
MIADIVRLFSSCQEVVDDPFFAATAASVEILSAHLVFPKKRWEEILKPRATAPCMLATLNYDGPF